MTEKWIETEKMKRLTMDNLEEMGMFSLAHNCCYIDENGNTRYRDFEIDIDARELAKGMLKEMTEDVVSFESDEDFDDWMGCYIGEDGICTQRGLIATFYQNLWAMAELREKLKYYEDLEEQGRLIVLPAPLKGVEFFSLDGRTKWVNFPFVPGDTAYLVTEVYQPCTAQGCLYESYSLYCDNCNDYCDSFKGYQVTEKSVKNWEDAIFLKGIAFHTKEEAEAALKRKEKRANG